jgi:hypothetical protein
MDASMAAAPLGERTSTGQGADKPADGADGALVLRKI